MEEAHRGDETVTWVLRPTAAVREAAAKMVARGAGRGSGAEPVEAAAVLLGALSLQAERASELERSLERRVVNDSDGEAIGSLERRVVNDSDGEATEAGGDGGEAMVAEGSRGLGGDEVEEEEAKG